MATETYFNDFGTTLNGAIDNSTTTLVVNNVSAFPNPFTGLQCRIRIDDEIMIVTAVNVGSSALTVTRGAESTTPVNHANAAQVVHILTAGGLTQVISQNGTNVVGTHASLPGSQTYSGQSYWATDRPYINIWNGSSYTQYLSPFASTPPIASAWTQVNWSNATITDTAGGVSIVSSGTGHRAAVIAVPATPYKVAMKFRMCIASNDSNSWGGAYWTNATTTGTSFVMATIRGNGNYVNFNGTNFTSPSFTTIYDPGGPTMGMHGNDFFVILGDDGTNRTIYNSADGYNFVTASGWPRVRTENSGMNYIGFGQQGTTNTVVTLQSWRVF